MCVLLAITLHYSKLIDSSCACLYMYPYQLFLHTHTDFDESPLQSGSGRTTLNTRSSKQAGGGTKADGNLKRLENTRPVAKRGVGKSSVLTGINSCTYI